MMLRTLILAWLAGNALAQPPLERAVALARERRYAEARQALAPAAEPAGIPQRIAFHRLKAAIASGLGEVADAADEMRRALALSPGDSGLLLATAAAELPAGRLEDALKHALAGGNSAVARSLIGDIQEKRGQYLEAAKAYQTAIALAPDREQYRLALALELVQHHTFEPAIAVLEQAAPLFPISARIRTLLGVAQYAVGHYAEAESALTDALAIDPRLEPVYRYLAQIALESPSAPLGRTLAAACGWNAIVCSALKSRVAHETGDAAMREEAVAGLKQAPAENGIARCELGRVYQSGGEWTQARAEMESCVRLDPTPQNHYRLGLVYNRLGLEDLAREQMELRNALAGRMTEEIARREKAVQVFEYLAK
jgi:tetratricopeptide (TPR) repeat protein